MLWDCHQRLSTLHNSFWRLSMLWNCYKRLSSGVVELASSSLDAVELLQAFFYVAGLPSASFDDAELLLASLDVVELVKQTKWNSSSCIYILISSVLIIKTSVWGFLAATSSVMQAKGKDLMASAKAKTFIHRTSNWQRGHAINARIWLLQPKNRHF